METIKILGSVRLKSCFFFLLFIICLAGQAQTARIKNFNDLVASLNNGEQVRVVIHYAKCKLSIDGTQQSTAPDAVTGMDIDTFEYFAPGATHNKNAFLVFSQMKMIQNPIGKGFVYNYGKVRVSEDDSVIVSAKYVNPKNYKVVMDESFSCILNNGTNGGGIDLFKSY
jgi:hypothetical protein